MTECEYGGQDEQVCATQRVIFFSKQPTSKCNFMKTWQGKSEKPILLKYFCALIEGNCTHWVRFRRRKTNICGDLRSCSAPKSLCYFHRGSECQASTTGGHSHLLLWLQGIWCPHLAFVGTCAHVYMTICRHTNMYIHTHTITNKIFFKRKNGGTHL